MNWKKQIIALAICAVLLVTINITMAGSGFFKDAVIPDFNVAVQPLDGYYEGITSQGTTISFNVVSGQVQSLNWNIYPMCNGQNWGFGGWWTTSYGNFFTWNYNIVQDESGFPSGIVPMSNMGVFGYGSFDSETHAKGGIWDVMAYFNGVGLKTISCSDNTITYEANYVGPVAVKNTPQSQTVTNIVQ